MALELRQQLKLTQQLIMTPQLQMAIKLLQLSRLELVDTIRQELEENPALEEVIDSTGDGPAVDLDLGRWEGRVDQPAWGDFLIEGRARMGRDHLTVKQLRLEIDQKGRLEAAGQWSTQAPFDGELRVDLRHLQWSAVPPLPRTSARATLPRR